MASQSAAIGTNFGDFNLDKAALPMTASLASLAFEGVRTHVQDWQTGVRVVVLCVSVYSIPIRFMLSDIIREEEKNWIND